MRGIKGVKAFLELLAHRGRLGIDHMGGGKSWLLIVILDVVCNIEDRRVYMYGTEKAQADKA